MFAAFFTRPEIGFKPRSRDDEHAIAMKPRKHKKLSTFYEDEDGDGDGAVGGRGGRDSADGASQRAAKRESFERGKAPARDPVELVDDEDEDAPDENDVNAVTMVRDRTPRRETRAAARGPSPTPPVPSPRRGCQVFEIAPQIAFASSPTLTVPPPSPPRLDRADAAVPVPAGLLRHTGGGAEALPGGVRRAPAPPPPPTSYP